MKDTQKPLKRKIFKLSEVDRIEYVRDTLDTFPSANQAAIGMSKDSLFWCATKHILSALGKNELLRKTNVGEFRIYHTALATLLISQIDPLEGINIKTLKVATISQFHTATQKHYLAGNYDYVGKTFNRVFNELMEAGIITTGSGNKRSKNIYLHDASPTKLLSTMYGKSISHGTGISSWKRAYLSGFLTHHRGVDPTTIVLFSQRLHNEEFLRKDDPIKFINIHGRDGTGLVVNDAKGGWWRCYDRVSNPYPLDLKGYNDQEMAAIGRALKIVTAMPFIGHASLGKLTSEFAVKVLNKIARNKANSILVEYSNCFVEARHVIALKLGREKMIDYDMVIKVNGMWTRVSNILVKSKPSAVSMSHGGKEYLEFESKITEIQELLIRLAEEQKIKVTGTMNEQLMEYLVEIGQVQLNPLGYYELLTASVGFYLTLLSFAGVMI